MTKAALTVKITKPTTNHQGWYNRCVFIAPAEVRTQMKRVPQLTKISYPLLVRTREEVIAEGILGSQIFRHFQSIEIRTPGRAISTPANIETDVIEQFEPLLTPGTDENTLKLAFVGERADYRQLVTDIESQATSFTSQLGIRSVLSRPLEDIEKSGSEHEKIVARYFHALKTTLADRMLEEQMWVFFSQDQTRRPTVEHQTTFSQFSKATRRRIAAAFNMSLKTIAPATRKDIINGVGLAPIAIVGWITCSIFWGVDFDNFENFKNISTEMKTYMKPLGFLAYLALMGTSFAALWNLISLVTARKRKRTYNFDQSIQKTLSAHLRPVNAWAREIEKGIASATALAAEEESRQHEALVDEEVAKAAAAASTTTPNNPQHARAAAQSEVDAGTDRGRRARAASRQGEPTK